MNGGKRPPQGKGRRRHGRNKGRPDGTNDRQEGRFGGYGQSQHDAGSRWRQIAAARKNGQPITPGPAPGPGPNRPNDGYRDGGPQDRSQGRRRHRRGRGRGKGGYDQQQPQQPQRNYPSPRPTNGTYPSGRREDGSLDPFELFCAYHLGITADGRYRQQNIHDLSRRFNCSPAEIKQALADYELDPKTLINSDFDMSMAQLDIMVAPEGVDRRELARPWYEEFRRAHPNVRDWQKELEEDARANAEIFGDGDSSDKG